MEIKKNDISLCTVSYNSRKILDLNYDIITSRNPGTTFDWIVAENYTQPSKERISSSDRRFSVIDGINKTPKKYGEDSNHHAQALNKAIREVTSRFAAIIDPDFFLIKENILRDIIDHMIENDLAFFGAPWHPKWNVKYHDFPCVHFMVIDLDKIDKKSFDFSPDCNNIRKFIARSLYEKLHRKLIISIASLFIGKQTTENIKTTCTSRDTGWKIYRDYSRNSNTYFETATPCIEQALPTHNSIILPTALRTTTGTNYPSDPISKLSIKTDSELFLWNEEILGLHLRCYPKRLNDTYDTVKNDIQELRGLLELDDGS